MSRRFRPAACALLPVLVALGCSKPEITAYRIPKETDPAMPALTGPAESATPGTAGAEVALTWSAPGHWTAEAGNAMRKGSFRVRDTAGGEADMSITSFPGDAGGLVDNVNRWRGQIGLPAQTEAQITGVVQHLDSNGLHFDIVEFANPAGAPPQRILGAIVAAGSATWFFKLSGPDALVAREKAAFLELIRSVRTP